MWGLIPNSCLRCGTCMSWIACANSWWGFEPCDSTVGFDFSKVEFIQVEKKTHLSQRLNLC
jgi:hypothetical protein